jgi:hypothetical protein
MIPSQADARWKALVQGNKEYPLKGLAARMVITRARLIASRKDAQSVQTAVDTVYTFFSKNVESARDDIHAIFG